MQQKWRAKFWTKRGQSPAWLEILLLLILCFIAGGTVRSLQRIILIEQTIASMKQEKIDYDKFRDMKVENLLKNPKMDGGQLASLFLSDEMEREKPIYSDKELLTIKNKISSQIGYQEITKHYRSLLNDLIYFPVHISEEETIKINYEDSWKAPRTYGGDRKHEGTDLMAGNNLRGYFTIVSMTDGVVEKIGWLEQGGYRIGIRSSNGLYCYYAHLHSYAPGLVLGSKVSAGDELGLMGDTGYGKEEGTVGMFDVHLHLGIFMKLGDTELSINPYWLLRWLESR